jgi:hypothetical protein
MENNDRNSEVRRITDKFEKNTSPEVELDAIKKFGRPSAATNVEVLVQNKEASVVIGAKIFISAEDAKCILLLTECRPLRKGQQAIDGEMERMEALQNARYLLRKFAKAVLYTPVETSNTMLDISNKY